MKVGRRCENIGLHSICIFSSFHFRWFIPRLDVVSVAGDSAQLDWRPGSFDGHEICRQCQEDLLSDYRYRYFKFSSCWKILSHSKDCNFLQEILLFPFPPLEIMISYSNRSPSHLFSGLTAVISIFLGERPFSLLMFEGVTLVCHFCKRFFFQLTSFL